MAMVGRAVLVVLLAGCFTPPPAAPSPPANTAPSTSSTRTRDYRMTIADPLGFLPIDSEVVLAIDIDELRSSAVWPVIEPRLRQSLGPMFAGFHATCGFDPGATIRGITAGARDLKGAAPAVTFVITGLPRDRTLECLRPIAGKTHGTMSLVLEGDVLLTRDVGSGDAAALIFVDDSTVVGTTGRSVTKAALERVLASGAPLRRSPAFLELFAQVDTSATIWGVANGQSSLFDAAAGLGMKPSAVFGALRLDDGASLAARVRLDSPVSAQQLAAQVQAQVGIASSLFDRLDISADDLDLVVNAEMGDAKLASVLALLGASTPAPPSAPTLLPTP